MNTLLIFIKNPRLGYVKTRLAATVGNEEALRIYHILLEKTRLAALNTAARRLLFYSDTIESDDNWPADAFEKKVQASGDLGDRMQAAFADAFASGTNRAVIIGSDCPTLTGAILEQAFEALESSDFVLGPTPDGGYYLLGMNTLAPELFKDMAWSTEQVFATTIDRITAAGASYALLPVLSDIDNEADWNHFELFVPE